MLKIRKQRFKKKKSKRNAFKFIYKATNNQQATEALKKSKHNYKRVVFWEIYVFFLLEKTSSIVGSFLNTTKNACRKTMEYKE